MLKDLQAEQVRVEQIWSVFDHILAPGALIVKVFTKHISEALAALQTFKVIVVLDNRLDLITLVCEDVLDTAGCLKEFEEV